MDVRIVCTHPQFVVAEIKNMGRIWNTAFVYASPDHHLRGKLWNDLRRDNLNLHNAWMAVGDFNAVTSMAEVSNPETFNQRRCVGINDWIFEEGLVDLGFMGPKYTWMRGRDIDNFKGARLDRAVSSTDWLSLFPNAKVHHLPLYNSDHAPLLISLDNKPVTRKTGFKF